MHNASEHSPNRLSVATVIIISIIVVAGVFGNIYTYRIFSNTVQNLEHKVSTLQTQISALNSALGNYSQASIGNVSLSELYENTKDSVVLVRGQGEHGEVAGSGFVYNYSSGTHSRVVIITNYHVVQGTQSRSITLRNGHAYAAQILGVDAYSDLAVLSADHAPANEFKPLPIISSSTLEVGDFVIALGNPYELIGSVTTGIVSQLGRAIPEELAGGYSIANVIQISAPLNPGNSGGPLFNSKGQVVGITFAIIANSTGVGFAIPSDTVLREIAWLVAGDSYPHSWIGVAGTDMTYELAKEIGSNVTYGFLVMAVEAPSPAHNAGLEVDDVIIAINDTQVISGDDVSNYLEAHTSPGQIIRITVERQYPVRTVTRDLVLGIRPPPPN
ncbi:MAG: trypsin-like peptidase domain-containing protein [Candidatus Bathyarchaeota archaeon]|nr:MAG: trypsin-like peptidase domain-containing protein [Candidatus Bathyarchaeota archaeon]